MQWHPRPAVRNAQQVADLVTSMHSAKRIRVGNHYAGRESSRPVGEVVVEEDLQQDVTVTVCDGQYYTKALPCPAGASQALAEADIVSVMMKFLLVFKLI